MNKALLGIVVVLFALMIPALIVNADQFVDEQARVQFVINRAAEAYRDTAGRDPSMDNLLDSLASDQESKTKEVRAALEYLIMSGLVNPILKDKVFNCYEAATDWIIQIKCLNLLSRLDKRRGVSLSEDYIVNMENPLMARLLLAKNLIHQEILVGYPVLKEGLVSTDVSARNASKSLFISFKKYDGMVYNGRRDKVNLKQLLLDANQRVDLIRKDLAALESAIEHDGHKPKANEQKTSE